MQDKMERVLLRPVEVAQMIGVSRSKVYELIAGGVLPAVRLEGGRLIRVPCEAVSRMAKAAMEQREGDQ
jgi:excisionase family DNA binding protein